MYYAIFTCRLTIDLLAAYGDLYGVIVPIEHKRRFNDRKHTVDEVDRAAMPGFVFVPLAHSKEIRRRVPEAYYLRQLMTFNGNECLITRRELDDLQDRLELEYTGAYTFKQGDKVIVHFHPLSKHGAEGEIVKFRSSGKARVKLRKLNSFVEVPQIMLSKVG